SDRAHTDPRLIRERLEESGLLSGRPAPAPRVDVDRARLGDRAVRDDERSADRRGGRGRHSLEERATLHDHPPSRYRSPAHVTLGSPSRYAMAAPALDRLLH